MKRYNIPSDPYLRNLIRRIAKPEKSLEALIQAIAWYQKNGNDSDVTLANFEVGLITKTNNAILNCDAGLAELGIINCSRCYNKTAGYVHCLFCLGTGYMHRTNLSANTFDFIHNPGLFEEDIILPNPRFDKIIYLIYK